MGDAATPVLPDFTSQSAAVYKASIDAGFAVADRLAWAFAPHEQASPDMTVRLDAGAILDGETLTEVAAQSSATITAPAGNPRIDRIVIDTTTGAVSVVAGSEAASPTPPAIPADQFPAAQVLLDNSPVTTEITNDLITDERASFSKSVTLPTATTTVAGIAELATSAETITGTDTGRVVTPAGLAAKVATTTAKGIIERSTSAENVAGTNNTVYPTVAGTKEMIDTHAGGGLVLLATASASASASIDFESGELSATYDEYILKITNLVPATESVVRLRTDDDAGASDYTWTVRSHDSAGAAESAQDAADSEIQLNATQNVGNAAGEGFSATVHISGPADTARDTLIYWDGIHQDVGGRAQFIRGGGFRNAAAAVAKISIFMAADNITSGEFALYGMVKT